MEKPSRRAIVRQMAKPFASFCLHTWLRAPLFPPLSLTPCSACSVLPPPLLACLHDFAHLPRWSNLEDAAIGQRRMLANELYSMIHVPRLKNENATELFLGFRVGTVGGCHFAVLPVNGQRGFRRLESFSASPVPVGAKMVIVIKACVEHGVLFSRGHALEFAFVVVSETDVFHCSSPHSALAEPAAERCAGSLISSLRRVFRGCSRQIVYLLSPGPCSGAG